jgi:hypothetical protein
VVGGFVWTIANAPRSKPRTRSCAEEYQVGMLASPSRSTMRVTVAYGWPSAAFRT